MPPTRIPPSILTLCVTVATALAVVAPAQARTIEPSTNADVRANDGQCSLREAITSSATRMPSGAAGGECPAGEGGDTIRLAATSYQLAGAPGDDNNASGDLDVLDSLTIEGRGPAETTIDAQGVDRVIEVGASPTGALAVTIDGVKITGGKAPDGANRLATGGRGNVTGDLGGAGTGGGGILSRATLTVRNSAVVGNRAGNGGRGGNANAADGDPDFIDPGFAATGGNGGPGGDGGGIQSVGKLLTVENSRITGNAAGTGGMGGVGFGGDGARGSGSAGGEKGGPGTGGRGALGGNGGGIATAQRLKVIDSVIGNNASGAGGAGGTGVGGFGGLWGNYAPSPGGDGAAGTGGRGGAAGYGGGIAADAEADIRRTLIGPNNAATGGAGGNGVGGGGGLGDDDPLGKGGAGGRGVGGNAGAGGATAGLLAAGATTVENATVTANLAGDGGEAGDAIGGAGGTGHTRGRGGDALAGNGGEGGGGAAIAQALGGTLTHVTVYENAVGGGGGSGDTTSGAGAPAGLSQPGVKGPRGNVGAIWAFPGQTTLLRNSIVASNSGGNCTGTVADGGRDIAFGDASCPGTQADPLLGALQDHGGPTPTLAIADQSPARDLVPAGGAECTATDQRGTARPQGPACDSGAFEIGPPPGTGELPGGEAPGGDGPGDAGGPGSDTVAPLFTSASLTPKVFTVDRRGRAETAVAARRKRGTTFRYSLSEQARVTFTIERKTGRRRYKRAGRFALTGKSGTNRHRFTGRIGRRVLKPGSYRATLVATDGAGNRSKPRRLTFRVVRR